ncbi:TRAF-interacting protein with FHA domain-containing protein A [Spea bombifrons]|uniref:TRAF-interacting protein with FHA domain-containing protein A n=1 Tax=Spea bombifrons TaxID=233779 RepID=UPI00234BCDF3|nr:TRAF-interacting protein with FHA domain-containing protein A [Spea bombifrons]
MAQAPVTNDAETEQTLTCLHLRMYHPQQHSKQIFKSIKVGHRQEIKAEEVVTFGRDFKICNYPLLSSTASRIQFSLEFFKPFQSGTTAFAIKNLSKKYKLSVDHLELDYLNKKDLPDTCLIRFGEFQILAEKEDGESENMFEICCEVSRTPLFQEHVRVPIPENGALNGAAPIAEEVDENEL